MDVTICCWLPLLRGPLPQGLASGLRPEWPGVRNFWPGLPLAPAEAQDADSLYQPDDLPFSPEVAKHCLAELRAMDVRLLQSLPAGNNALETSRALREQAEIAMLGDMGAALAGNGSAEREKRKQLEREQAQKTLLWLWLQEERLAELAEIAANYAERSRSFASVLGAEGEDSQPLPGWTSDWMTTPITMDSSLVPPWHLAVHAAAMFLPPSVAIAACDQMQADVHERLDLRPAPEYAGLLSRPGARQVPGDEILAARAPLWQVTGNSRPLNNRSMTGSGPESPMNIERLWIVPSSQADAR